jgi:hypothetical protein
MAESVREAARELEIAGDFDTLVCGGGPAGVCAALAAARAGAKTLLLESAGCLGGTWTSGLLGWVIDHGGKEGIIKELREELRRRKACAANAPSSGSFPFDIEAMKLLLEEKCLAAGVRIRLHTHCVAAVKNSAGLLDAAITESKSGREAWRAKTFVDCSGDGDLGAFAGCSFSLGNAEGLMQPMSLLCLLTGLDFDAVKDCVNGYGKEWLSSKANMKAALEAGGVSPTYGFPTLFLLCDGLYMLMANHQYKKSGLNADDLSDATVSARAEINRQVEALRSQGGRWAGLRLVATAGQIGVREGRRLKGLYEVTEKDLASGARHEDAVCRVAFGIDVHALDPARNKGIETPKVKSQPYDVPLRALKSSEVANLLMAGRCVSGDFIAHSSYRVTGNAAVLGEAAGREAARLAKSVR